MSEKRTSGNNDNGNTQDNTDIPVLLAVNRREHRLIDQDYSPLIIIENSNSDIQKAPEFFNEVLERHLKPNTVIGFLSAHDFLYTKNAISTIIQYLKNSVAAIAYTDGYLVHQSYIPQIMPSFTKNTLDNLIINTPLFMAAEMTSRFNTELNTMYFYDMFRLLGQKKMIIHIPEPVIYTYYHTIDNNEIKIVQDKYESQSN